MRKELGIMPLSIVTNTIDEEFALDFLQYACNLTYRAIYSAPKDHIRFKKDTVNAVLDNIKELANQLNTYLVFDKDMHEFFLLYDDEISKVTPNNYPEIKA